MPIHRAAAILATTMIAGCVASQPTHEQLGPIAAADFDAKFDGAVCAVWTRCGYYASIADCVAAMPLSQQLTRLQRLASIARGTVAYDGSLAAACITDIAASSCDRVGLALGWKGERLCQPYEHGVVPAGGACHHDEECESNGCEIDDTSCSGACCPGHCIHDVSVGAGGDCGTDRARCGDGTTCHDGICRRDRPVGAECLFHEDCASDLVCDNGTCSRAATADELCAHTGRCGTIGLSCELTPSGSHCFAFADIGQPCRIPGDIADRPPCKPDAVCEAQHRLCIPLPAAGEDCPDHACAPGAFCLGVPEDAPTRSVCRTLLPVGTACARDEQCASYLCAPATHTCVPSETAVCSVADDQAP